MRESSPSSDHTDISGSSEDTVHPDLEKIKLVRQSRGQPEEPILYYYRITFDHEDVDNIPPGELRSAEGVYSQRKLSEEELVAVVAQQRDEARAALAREKAFRTQTRSLRHFGMVFSTPPLPDITSKVDKLDC